MHEHNYANIKLSQTNFMNLTLQFFWVHNSNVDYRFKRFPRLSIYLTGKATSVMPFSYSCSRQVSIIISSQLVDISM